MQKRLIKIGDSVDFQPKSSVISCVPSELYYTLLLGRIKFRHPICEDMYTHILVFHKQYRLSLGFRFKVIVLVESKKANKISLHSYFKDATLTKLLKIVGAHSA